MWPLGAFLWVAIFDLPHQPFSGNEIKWKTIELRRSNSGGMWYTQMFKLKWCQRWPCTSVFLMRSLWCRRRHLHLWGTQQAWHQLGRPVWGRSAPEMLPSGCPASVPLDRPMGGGCASECCTSGFSTLLMSTQVALTHIPSSPHISLVG